jgi:hypothetical protein
LAFCLFSQQVAVAQTACKGLTQSACVSAEACSWVKGFATKDGRKVEAFCRKKGIRAAKPKPETPAQTKPKAEPAKEGKKAS